MNYLEQIRLPRYESGSDWGVDRPLLLQKGDKKLWVWRGHTAWSGLGQTTYYSTKLMYTDKNSGVIGTTIREFEKGDRFGKKFLSQFDQQIKGLFRVEFNFSEHYKRGFSLILED